MRVERRKPDVKYEFTRVPFLYDPDDYRYIPGLERPHASGFLTPVFFSRRVLMKYETQPEYRVEFASTTYGTIYAEEWYISFGINKNGKVLMWLGDIGKLPEAEQHYLRSENVESDHSVGSEFYEGQIDIVYTPPAIENQLFARRSEFVNACFLKFGTKIAHLDEEVLKLAGAFHAPVIDTERERRHVADTLNKIYVESLDSNALGALMKKAGTEPGKLGGLKRLQAVIQSVAKAEDVAALLSPLFVLYDFRVACLHLGSDEGSKEKLKFVTDRLGIPETATLTEIYAALTAALMRSFERLTALVKDSRLERP